MGESGSSAAPPTILAPGFRFHPTDEELVYYWLRRKLLRKRLSADIISEIDIYKYEPLDLPGLSKLKSRDREWYFFSALDRKYGNGMRTNRATEHGYWKTTGKDRPVHRDGGSVVGMKKTLVYHFGRAPHGKRTDWVMHEYKLVDKKLETDGYPLEGFVLCRVFQKSGSGPKNGEQYGAKFEEKEWEDKDVTCAVAGGVLYEDPYADDDVDADAPAAFTATADAFNEQIDLPQVLDPQLPQSIPLPDEFNNQGDQMINGTDQKPPVGDQTYDSGLQALDDQMICDLVEAGSSANVVKNEYIAAPVDECNQGHFSLDELFPNDGGSAPFDDGQYFDAFDSLDPALFDSILNDDVDISAYLNPDYLLDQIDTDANLGLLPKQFTCQNLDDTFCQKPSASEQLPGSSIDSTGSSSHQVMDDKPSKRVLSEANMWLKNLPAPPAFASEMPTKDMASRLAAASSSIHVTAGMIRIRDMNMPFGARGSGLQWSIDKTGNVRFLLSFDVPQTTSPAELESAGGISSSKVAAAVSRGWLYFMCFWMVALIVSLKVGTYIYAN